MKQYILLIEDDAPIQQFLSMALSKEGYEVGSAPNGAVALDMIAAQRPDLIVLDMWMPQMDGDQFLRSYLDTCNQPAPIIVMTADHMTISSREQAEAVAAVIIKPFLLDDMLDCIERCIRGEKVKAG